MGEHRGEYKRSIISYKPLQALLRERGMTDLQLAQRIGEKVAVVRNIQLNADTTTMEIIRKICEVLKCHPGDIMCREEVTVIPARKNDPDE